MRHLVLALAGLCFAAPLAAQQVPAERGEERTHVVRPGDTLWDIARLYLNDPLLWPEIFRLNADIIRDPARIFPSYRLRLPEGVAARLTGDVEPARTIFFPREEVGTQQAVPTIRAAGTADVPVLNPGDFYRAGFLARDRDVAPLGRIAERLAPSVVPIELPGQIQLYDRIFVALAPGGAVQLGDRFHFYRPDRGVRAYGRVFQPTGIATVAALNGDVATAVVIQVFDAISVGDLALPLEPFPVPAGVAPEPRTGVQGSIVAFQNPHFLQATQNIAFLNVGRESGLEEGDEFVAFLPPQRMRWGTRPEVEIARLQVIRVADRTAAARVVSLTHPALDLGTSVRLVAKMPG